jgi:hypothetical protein
MWFYVAENFDLASNFKWETMALTSGTYPVF